MLKPIRIAVATLAATAVVGMSASGAGAIVDGTDATSGVTANVTAGTIGSRSITLASAVTMSSALDATTLSGQLATTVTEAVRTGTNPWRVTATLGDLTNATVTPNATLANSNMAVSTRAVVQVNGGGTATAPEGSEPMSATRTLFENNGQSGGAIYTGSYASTSTWTLSLPNETKTGVYTGTITLDLVQ